MPHGTVFRLETDEHFTAIECSDFNLFSRYLHEGQNVIVPVLKERAAIGFNMLRVWTAMQGIGPNGPTFEREVGRLVPSEEPDMYNQLPKFLALCASYGLYVELTAFTGLAIPGHWEMLGAAVQGISNVIVELVNEHNAHPSINPNDYHPIPGVVCSHGSNGSQSAPVRPPWPNGYEAFHTNGAPEWWRKGGHNGMEFSEGDAEGIIVPSHLPMLVNENTRPDQDGNINHHYDAAAACALLVAGSCCHTSSGKKSALFSDFDRPFAVAHVAGARSVNLEFQDGHYSHVISDEGPGDLRVYRKTLSDGRFTLVRIRK